MRGIPLVAALVAGFLAATPAPAAETDPIDAALEACLDRDNGQTTAGAIACTLEATRAWDRRLNETYQSAMKGLDPKSRELLRTAQRQWLTYRKAEAAAQDGPWTVSRGTMVRQEIVGAWLEGLKERVREIQLYLGDE